MNKSLTEQLLNRDQIDIIISDYLKLKLSYRALLEKINSLTPVLSEYDKFYIGKKYSELLIELWLIEAPENVDLSDPKSLKQVLSTLSSIKSFQGCSSLIGKSIYHDLICDFIKHSEFLKRQELNCIYRFKRACHNRIQQHANCVKHEISFLTHLCQLLKLSQNPRNLCDKIQLTELMNSNDINETNFQQFLFHLSTIDSNEKHILDLQHLVHELLGVNKYYFINGLQETLSSYLKEVTVNQLSVDGREVLEVSGTHIVLSKALPRIIIRPRFLLIDEVRFVNSEVVHVDADLISSDWHGKNIVLYSKCLIIDINRLYCWDVSGDGINGAEAQREVGNSESSGADGTDGESGGNILIVVDNVVNGKHLIIISNGGNGSNGLDGRSGKDGKDGESLSDRDFKQKFPPVSKYRDIEKMACLKTTYENVIDELSSVEYLLLGNSRIHQIDMFKELLDKHVNDLGNIYFEVTKTNGCKITFSFYNRPLVPFSSCYSFLLFKGSPGSEGEAGQRGGEGGNKGFAGDINIYMKESNDHDIKMFQEDGISGNDGKRGNNGVCGKSGLDKAYMDISFTATTFPVMFLPSDSITLKVEYYLEEKGVCVYTPRGKYATIVCCEKDFKRSHCVKFNFHAARTRYHQTSRKKTISLKDTLSRYGQKITIANLCELSLYLEETKQIMDINIDETKSQVDEEITVKRVCNGSSKLHVPKFWLKCDSDASLDKVLPSVKPLKDVNSLLKLVEEDPKDIKNWANLVQLKLDFEQLKHLWITSVSLQVGKNGDLLLNEYVKKLLCNKLELSIIKLFDMQHFQSLIKEFPHTAGYVRLVNKTCCVASNTKMPFHKVLPFFCKDSVVKRSEVKTICQLYISGTQFWDIVTTCILELTSSCPEYPRLEELFIKSKRFESQKLYEVNQKFCPVKNLLMTSKDIKLQQVLLDGVVNVNSSSLFKVDQLLTFSSDIFVRKSHIIYCNAVKKDFCFGRNCSEQDRKQLTELLNEIILVKGPSSKIYREILAHYFKTNIIIYSRSDFHNKIKIVDNHNPQAAEKIHLLMKEEQFLLLDIDNGFVSHGSHDCFQLVSDNGLVNFINTLKVTGKLYSIFLHNIGSFTEFNQFVEYLKKPLMLDDIDRSSTIRVKIRHILTEDDDLKSIKDCLFSEEDKIILIPRLEKLKMEYIGYGSFIHYMALHFKEEGNTATTMELAAITNFVIKSSTDAPYLLPVISWIIAAHSQTEWLIEIVLLKLSLYFKQELDCDVLKKWRTYFSELKVKDGLVLLCEQISSCNKTNCVITIVLLEEVFYLMSCTPNSYVGLNGIDISEWKYYLKDKYWINQLSTVTNWSEIQLNSISYFLSSLENGFGMKTCQKLLSILLNLKNLSSIEMKLIENTFRELVFDEIEINEQLINSLSRVSIFQWQGVLKKHQTLGVERSVPELLKLINESGNTSTNIQRRLGEFEECTKLTNVIIEILEEKIKDANGLRCWVSILLKTLHSRKGSTSSRSKMLLLLPNFTLEYISKLSELLSSGFKQKSGDYSNLLNEIFQVLSVNRSYSYEDHNNMLNYILIATVFLAIGICKKIKLRETQKLAVFMFLKSDKNILGQVSTGEGKSIIVVSVAIIKVLLNSQTIDIITSSHVLARRDALEHIEIYELFNVSVGHNCCGEIEERKKVYSSCQIVYGELGNFQRDYLLDRFYDKNVLGDRKFQSIIVDEVDSMLMDQSSNMLYLSHDVPDLDKLEPVFVYIWRCLNIPRKLNQIIPSATLLRESILFDIFGWLNKDQIRHLETGISDEQVNFTWEQLIKKGFISETGQLMKHKIEEASFETNEWSKCISEEHLKYLMAKLVERDKQLEVPNHLKHFVATHLDEWIKSAFDAISMENNRDYVVDIDRSSSNSDCNPNIIILDHDTGTDLTNSHWDGGLHQFLQLKHGCRLSLLSLKAVFISNISFFRSYESLYGLTGTLGSTRERDLLKDVYNVDFVTIPTSKPKSFVEYTPIICSSDAEWTETILKQAYAMSQNRSTLVICESISNVTMLEKKFSEFFKSGKDKRKVVTYKRDYEQFKVAEKLEPGYIVISTNLAGRGTDIKLSKELISAGGLHICLTFLPSNRRIEEQAYGRVSRNGVAGSAQIIFLNQNPSVSKAIEIKKLRDTNEYLRLLERKKDYETKIKFEEQNFEKFKTTYESLKNLIYPKEVKSVLLQECISQWTFWLVDSFKNKSAPSIESFLNNILKLGDKDIRTQIGMVKNPSNLIKLGLFYIKDRQFQNSIVALNKVIDEEPHFSGIARYYRICAESMDVDIDHDYVINELQIAKTQLNHRIDSLILNMETINRLKLHDPQSNLQYDSFKEQQENIVKMYLVFTESIDKIIGQNIDRIFLENEHIIYDLAEDKFVIKLQISSSLVIDELTFVREYGLDPRKVFDFFKSFNDMREFSLKQFVDTCPLPSRELFWNELIGSSILTDEEKYIMIDAKKLSNVDPSLKRRIETLAVEVDPDERNQVWLYRQEEVSAKFGQTLFTTISICEAAGENMMRKLEDLNIIMINKRATLMIAREDHLPLSFASIGIEEFGQVRIGKITAQGILGELREMQILNKNINSTHNLSMMVDLNDLKCITLSKYKGYSVDVKGLIIFHFTFHFALRHLIYQLNQGEILKIPLQIMPHNSIVYNLIEREIIKTVFNPYVNIDALFPEEMDIEDWKNIFKKHYDCEESGEIVNYLITNDCLSQVPCNLICSPFIHSRKYIVKTNEEGLVNFPLPVKWENESIRQLLEREYETIRLLIKQQEHKKSRLKEAEGFLKKVVTVGFTLIPVAEVLQKNGLSTTEMNIFSLNGFDYVLNLGEKKWSGRMKLGVSLTTMIGIAQIGIGAALEITAVCTPWSAVLISGGANDLVFSIICCATGLFSWKSYLENKVMNIALSFAAGLNKLYSSMFGKKMVVDVLSTLESNGSKSVTVLRNKEIIKTVAVRVAKSVGIGVAYNTLPNIIEPQCQMVSNFLVTLFNSHIESVLDGHAINKNIESLCDRVGRIKCNQIVNKALLASLSRHPTKRNMCWDDAVQKVIRIFLEAISTIQELKLQFCNPQRRHTLNAVYSLGMLGKNVIDAIVSAKDAKLNDIIGIITMLMDDVDRRLSFIIESENIKVFYPLDRGNCQSTDIVRNIRDIVKDDLSCFVKENIVSPFLCLLGERILEQYSKLFLANKGLSKLQFPEHNKLHSINEPYLFNVDKYDEAIHSKTEFTKNETDFEVKINRKYQYLNLEYEDCLRKMFIERGSCELFAEIIEKNLVAESSCIKMFCIVIPALLKSHGVHLPGLEIILHKNGGSESYCTPLYNKSEFITVNVILDVNTGPFLKQNNCLVQDVFQATHKVLLKNYPEFSWNSEKMLREMLHAVKFDVKIRELMYKEKIQEKYNDGQGQKLSFQHFNPLVYPYSKSKWKLNSSIDVDLRNAFDSSEHPANRTASHINKGLLAALTKVNNHIYKVQSHLKLPFKLTLEDFNPTAIEVIPPTCWPPKTPFECQFHHYELVMPFKVEESNDLVDFNISLSLKNKRKDIKPHSPQGPHIVYAIEPSQIHLSHISMGVRGHVLLSAECNDLEYSADVCQTAGELVLPSNFQLSYRKKECKILVFGDSILKYISAYIRRPLCEVLICQDEIKSFAKTELECIPSCYTGIRCVVLHCLGKSVVSRKNKDDYFLILQELVEELKCNYKNTKIIICGMHMCKNTKQFHMAQTCNKKISDLNSIISSFCTLLGIGYIDTNCFIRENDLTIDGIYLNRRGLMKLGRHIENLNIDS